MWSIFNSISSFFFDNAFKTSVEYDPNTYTFTLYFSGKDAEFHREYITQIIQFFIDLSGAEEVEADGEIQGLNDFDNAKWIEKIQRIELAVARKITKDLYGGKEPTPIGVQELGLKNESATGRSESVADLQRKVFDTLSKKPFETKEKLLLPNNKLRREDDFFKATYLAAKMDSKLDELLNDRPDVNLLRSETIEDQLLVQPYLRQKHHEREVVKEVQECEKEVDIGLLENEKDGKKKIIEKLTGIIRKEVCLKAEYERSFDWPKEIRESSYIEATDSGEQQAIIRSKFQLVDDGKVTVVIVPLTEMEIQKDPISIDRSSDAIRCFQALCDRKEGDTLLLYLIVFNFRKSVIQAFQNLAVRKENQTRLNERRKLAKTTDEEASEEFYLDEWRIETKKQTKKRSVGMLQQEAIRKFRKNGWDRSLRIDELIRLLENFGEQIPVDRVNEFIFVLENLETTLGDRVNKLISLLENLGEEQISKDCVDKFISVLRNLEEEEIPVDRVNELISKIENLEEEQTSKDRVNKLISLLEKKSKKTPIGHVDGLISLLENLEKKQITVDRVNEDDSMSETVHPMDCLPTGTIESGNKVNYCFDTTEGSSHFLELLDWLGLLELSKRDEIREQLAGIHKVISYSELHL